VVASGSSDKTVRLWDATTGVARGTLKGHSSWVEAVAFSPDGKLVVSASDDKTVRLWDSDTGTVRKTVEGHSGWVLAVAFSPDVRLWGSETGTARKYSLASSIGRYLRLSRIEL
jgi:WD40 repeat protein